MADLKRCPICGESKDRAEYGTQSYCRPCHAAYIKARTPRKERQRPTPEEIREKARQRSLRWYHAHKDRTRKPPKPLGDCLECGQPIPPTRRSNARFCSERCAMRRGRARWVAANPEKDAASRQRYVDASVEQRRERLRRWVEQNPERQRLKAIRRRAWKLGAFVEEVDRLVVLERADGVCGICGEDVDPMSYHVDHIVPLARGGEHSYANSQPAHPTCNLRKGQKLVAA